MNLIPFGGYVKIHGEDPDEESTNGPDAARSFVNKPRWKQVIVLVAGVTFNFLFAWILYSVSFLSGVTATHDGFEKYINNFSNERVMVTYVAPDSPAAKAGFMEGDVIRDATTIQQVQDLISNSQGKTIFIEVAREGGNVSITPTPVKGLVEEKYAIGISMQNVGDLRLPFFTAIGEGFHYMLIMIRDTASGLYTFVANIFHGTAHLSDVSGPVGIAGIVGSAAKLGFTYLIMITALISINLGVINLIPFPALDGGRTIFVLIEGLIRRRIPAKFTNAINGIGFALLMLLMIVVTYKDIAKLFR